MLFAAQLATGRWSSGLLLLVSLVLVLAVAALGGIGTSGGLHEWYEGLDKAPWTPPAWVFGPAWTLLYILMAVAAWLVARAGLEQRAVQLALGLYLAQLALNLAWSWIFFGARAPGWAFLDIVALSILVALTALAFARVEPIAASLLAPYLGWLLFAASLNLWVALRN
ncbi:MAG: TspO/MBR family protein [Thermoleophilia bacterium]|nr:tryptophan-rich sensory protein [Gaiellaceae bacterium]MDW8338464.1 TspO/MBR family protein [Thermoleophilia bacterium]